MINVFNNGKYELQIKNDEMLFRKKENRRSIMISEFLTKIDKHLYLK